MVVREKRKSNCRNDEHICHHVVPTQILTHIEHCKSRKYSKRYCFLNDLQLSRRKPIVAPTIRWYLQAVFKERNTPTGENHTPQCRVLVFQMPIPGERHEHIARDQ